MTIRTAIAATACLGVLAFAGCTSSEGGTARPDPSSTAAPDSTGSPPGDSEAPRVEDPLDADAVLADPCSVLTPSQLTGFGAQTTGVPDTDSAVAKTVGPSCIWHPVDLAVAGSVSVSWQVGNKNGLSDTYRVRDRWSDFEETEVDGYPAVFTNDEDPAINGYCDIVVGISDTLTFAASEKGSKADGAADVCDEAKSVASAAIETLRGMQ